MRAAVAAATPLLLALLAAGVAEGATVTTSWINTDGGSWSDPANWDNGVPDETHDTTYNAVIGLSGIYTVTVDRNVTVESCMLPSNSEATLVIDASAELRVRGAPGIDAFVLTGEGSLQAGGRLIVRDGMCRFQTIGSVSGTIVLRDAAIDVMSVGSVPMDATIVAHGESRYSGQIPETWTVRAVANGIDGDARLTLDTGDIRSTVELDADDGTFGATLTLETELRIRDGGVLAVRAGAGGSRTITRAPGASGGGLEVDGGAILVEHDVVLDALDYVRLRDSFEFGPPIFTVAPGANVTILPPSVQIPPTYEVDFGLDGSLITIDGSVHAAFTNLTLPRDVAGGTFVVRDSRVATSPGGGTPAGSGPTIVTHGSCIYAGEVLPGWTVRAEANGADGDAVLAIQGAIEGLVELDAADDTFDATLELDGPMQIEPGATLAVRAGSGGSRTIRSREGGGGTADLEIRSGALVVEHDVALEGLGFVRFENPPGQPSSFSIAPGANLTIEGTSPLPSLTTDLDLGAVGGTYALDGTVHARFVRLSLPVDVPSGTFVLRDCSLQLQSSGGGSPGTGPTIVAHGDCTHIGGLPPGWTLRAVANAADGDARLATDGGIEGLLELDATDDGFGVALEFSGLQILPMGTLAVRAGAGGSRTISDVSSGTRVAVTGAQAPAPARLTAEGRVDIGDSRRGPRQLEVQGGAFLVEHDVVIESLERVVFFNSPASTFTLAAGVSMTVLGTPGPGIPSVDLDLGTGGGLYGIDGAVHLAYAQLTLPHDIGAGTFVVREGRVATSFAGPSPPKGVGPTIVTHGECIYGGAVLPDWTVRAEANGIDGDAVLRIQGSIEGLLELDGTDDTFGATLNLEGAMQILATGTLAVRAGSGGSRTIRGMDGGGPPDLEIQSGALVVEQDLAVEGVGRLRFVDSGQPPVFSLAADRALTFRGPPALPPYGPIFDLGFSGQGYAIDGEVHVAFATLELPRDIETATGAFVVRQGALSFSGFGGGMPGATGPTVKIHGECLVGGDVPPGYTLHVEATSLDGDARALGHFSNDGTVLLGSTGAFDAEIHPGESSEFFNGSEGVLTGTGRVVGNIRSEGTIAPGGSPDRIDVIGNLTFGPSGRYAADIVNDTPVTGHDLLTATGLVTLDGTLDVAADPSFSGTLFDVLTTTASVNGTFARHEGVDFAGVGLDPSYLPDRVRLSRIDVLADVTAPPLDAATEGFGTFFFDLEGDGDLDLHVVRANQPNQLFRNEGADVFADVTASTGDIGHAGNGRGNTWADMDNDGDLDVYVTNFGGPNVLLRNDGGTFADVTAPPLDDASTAWSAVWLDYDLDGLVDLFLTNQAIGVPNRLFHNDGAGAFSEAIGSGVEDPDSRTRSAAASDVDGDGDMDLYAVVINGPNRLFRNEGGSFVDVATGPLADAGSGRGCAFGDPDRDGDLDLALVNNTETRLLRNDGGIAFADVTAPPMGPGATGDATWADLDRDGDVDLVIASATGGVIYANDGDGTFRDGTPAALATLAGFGVTAGDYDADGDVDLFATGNTGPPRLLRNDSGAQNHWLAVELVGSASNRSAIGARIQVNPSGGFSVVREIGDGSGPTSQGTLEAFFGLGAATSIQTLLVIWPDGDATFMLPGPAVDQRIVITQDP